jgi:hypothetical protein
MRGHVKGVGRELVARACERLPCIPAGQRGSCAGFAAIAVIALLAPVIPIRPCRNNRNSGKYRDAKATVRNPSFSKRVAAPTAYQRASA